MLSEWIYIFVIGYVLGGLDVALIALIADYVEKRQEKNKVKN